METQGGPAHVAGIVRITALAGLGVGALTSMSQALTSGSVGVAALAAAFFFAFVLVARFPAGHPHGVRPAREAPSSSPTVAAESSPASPADPEASGEPEPPVTPATLTEPSSSVDAPPAAAVRMPATMDADVVAMALLESAATAGEAVAVHCWLEDPASATLRRVSAVGSMVPDAHPLTMDDDPLGLAARDGAARMTAVAAVHASGRTSTLWRFAVPVQADDARGVVGIDFASASMPDAAALVEITASLRGALTGCLALHVAHTELATARMLLETARELTRRLDPDEVIRHTLSRAMLVSEAATGSIMLLDPDTAVMRIAASEGLSEEIVRDTVVREGEGIAGWVLATKKPVLIEDLPGRNTGRGGEVRSAVSVPIADEDGILGVLNVGSREYPARFTDSHMEALRVLGTQTAVALRNARALTSARDLYFATLRALALAMETKDPYSRGGTDRVVRYATALGAELGLDEIEAQSLEVAALLHDIGMSASGEAVASTSRPLSTFERGLLKLHPVLAAEVLEEVPALQNVIPIVYHHHEWFDGRGYVVGLAGESIPLGSRILAVADAFVAMTSERPYRAAMSGAEALEELQDKAQTQFDPEVVAAFVELMRREPQLAPEARGQ